MSTSTMPEELRDKFIDFFEPSELIEYLGVSVEDILSAFEEDVEDKLHELLLLMGIKDEQS